MQINVPDWMSVDVIEQNFPDNTKKERFRDEKEGMTIYRYTFERLEPVVTEVNSPDYFQTYPYLLVIPKVATVEGKQVHYFDKMEHLYAWYKEPLTLLQEDENIIRAKAEEIIGESKHDEDKIKKLCAWVQRSIRYIAFANGISAFKPDNAQDVIHKKYGDCKGMSNLLKALLISQGFDARLAWIKSGGSEDESLFNLPRPFANHMICVLFRNDSVFYLDPTVRYLSLGDVPEQIQGKKIMIEDGEQYILSKTPIYPPERNTDSLFVNYRIEGDRIWGEATRTIKGDARNGLLYWLDSNSKSDQQTWLNDLLKRHDHRDSVFEVTTEGFDTLLPETVIRYKESRKSNLSVFGDAMYINMDINRDYQDATIDTLKRKTDYWYSYREYIVNVVTLDIPEGYDVTALPEDIVIEDDNYVFKLNYRKSDSQVVYRKEVTLLNPRIEKDDFSKWNQAVRQLNSGYDEPVILKKNLKNE